MKRTYTSRLTPGSKALVMGWVSHSRDLGGLKFFLLRDREGHVQVTAKKGSVPDSVLKTVESLSREDCISVAGTVKEAKQAPGGIEIIPESIEILSKSNTPLPIDIEGKIESGLDKRLDNRFLDLRNPKHSAIFRIRSHVFKACVDFFHSEEFININTPKITVAGVESGAELFPIVYFNREAFLSQSPQIYKQMMVAAGFEKVYEIAPVFRAEKSHTTRHLTEFTGIDFEMGFIRDMNDVMDVNERLIRHIVKHVKENCGRELETMGVSLRVPKKIPRLSLEEARTLLFKKGKKIPEGEDPDPEAEKLLGSMVKEKYGEELVFVYHYPWEKRPFYHMRPDGNPKVTESFDLIWNGVEIATGAQREHRYDVLKRQAKEKGIDLDSMKDYAAIFRYGCPPHGGTGLGLDRIVECMLGLKNIREAILLPRDPERLTP